jgi:hypothetical protein
VQYGNTPLHLAAVRNRVRVMALYLLHGARVDAAGHYGRTPIIEAASRSSFEATCMLVAQRANPLHPDATGLSAMDYAKVALAERPAAVRVAAFLQSVVSLRWSLSERLSLCVSRRWVEHFLACVQRFAAAGEIRHRLPRQVNTVDRQKKV